MLSFYKDVTEQEHPAVHIEYSFCYMSWYSRVKSTLKENSDMIPYFFDLIQNFYRNIL